jgi:glyoxylase-like metal-dependent hydrolase (beta-lactamase superfamily II)
MRRVLTVSVLGTLLSLQSTAQPRIDYAELEIKTTDLGHGVYLLGWQGGDSLILVGDDGVLLVDTSVAQMGDKIKAAIAAVTPKPIVYVVNTHAHADHFGSNESMAKDGAVIVAHDRLRERMAEGFVAFNQTIPPSPPAALPTVTYVDAMTLHFDGETIELYHPPNAHTDSDTLVRFKRANVIHASGTFGGTGAYPFFDMSSGGSLTGTIAAEEKMLSLADEGDPARAAALEASHDRLVTIRARVQKLIDEGKSENEAVAAKPTEDLDAGWLRQGGFLSGDVITRMAYQSLKRGIPCNAEIC